MNFNKIKRLNSKQKAINTSVVVIVISVLIFYFIIIPTIKNIKLLSPGIIEEKENIVKKDLKEKNIIALTEELSKIEPEINNYDKIYINDNNQLEFITAVEEIANKYNIEQKINITPPENLQKGKFAIVPILIDASGELNNIFNYLKEIESLDFQINVENFDLSSQATKPTKTVPQNDSINIKLNANTYWKKYEN